MPDGNFFIISIRARIRIVLRQEMNLLQNNYFYMLDLFPFLFYQVCKNANYTVKSLYNIIVWEGYYREQTGNCIPAWSSVMQFSKASLRGRQWREKNDIIEGIL